LLQHSRALLRRWLRGPGWRGFLFGLLLVVAADASGQTLERRQIEELERREAGVILDYAFRIEAEGSGAFGVSLLNPQGLAIPVVETQLGQFEAELIFETLANREAAFPNGTNQVFVNGAAVGSLEFDPIEADVFGSIASPSNLEIGVAEIPVFEFANGCSNCFMTAPGVTAPNTLELDLNSALGTSHASAFVVDETERSASAVRFRPANPTS